MNNSYCISLLKSHCPEVHDVSENGGEDIVKNLLLSQDVDINHRMFSKSYLELSIKSGHKITTLCAENVNRKSRDYSDAFCVVFGE